MKQHGDTVAGKKIEIIRKDTGGPNPDVAKRLAQELVVRDKVDILAGFALTPEALGAAGVSAEAKKLMVVMNAATSIITDQVALHRARFADAAADRATRSAPGQRRKAASRRPTRWCPTSVPGIDAERRLPEGVQGGGRRDRRLGAHAGRQSGLLGLRAARQGPQSGIDLRLRAGRRAAGGARQGFRRTRHRPEEDQDHEHRRSRSTKPRSRAWATLALGRISAWHYDYNHKSKMNADFVKAFNAEFKRNPDFFAVGGYDGMHLIYEALKKTGGKTDGDALIAAAKGMKWESPRGPISIDPETRDVVQTVYIRRVEKVGNDIVNVEFDKVENVKDPITGGVTA